MYIIGIQPKKREERVGKKAWEQCARIRSIAGIFEIIMFVCIILWIWFPVKELDFKIFGSYLISVSVAVILMIPFVIIMIKGVKDAGEETYKPSEEHEMYGGIYNYIRHPQTPGEFSAFILLALAVDSWFLFFLLLIFSVIYIPIMIHFEEVDLIRRFGEKYEEYRRRTGALFPKIFRSKA